MSEKHTPHIDPRGYVLNYVCDVHPDLDLAALDGGLHAVLRFQHVDAAKLADGTLSRRVRAATLAAYYARALRRNGIVIGYEAPRDLEPAKAFDVIASLLNEDGTFSPYRPAEAGAAGNQLLD